MLPTVASDSRLDRSGYRRVAGSGSLHHWTVVSRTPRRLNVNLVFNVETTVTKPPPRGSVGIDPGVKHLLTAVDDTKHVVQILGNDDSATPKGQTTTGCRPQRAQGTVRSAPEPER